MHCGTHLVPSRLAPLWGKQPTLACACRLPGLLDHHLQLPDRASDILGGSAHLGPAQLAALQGRAVAIGMMQLGIQCSCCNAVQLSSSPGCSV